MLMNFNNEIEKMQDELIGAVDRLVRIRSVEDLGGGGKPFGTGVYDCLCEALAMSEELGFTAHNMDDECGFCEYGDGDEMIAILGHLDVVPEGDGWSHDPYKPEIIDGRMYGRGTIDDKGPVAASLYALKAVKDSGIPLKRRVRLIYGCNEETGAEDMKYYLKHGGEIPVAGFTPDGEYPLINGEKGIINEVYETGYDQTGDFRLESFRGGVAGNVTPPFAKADILVPDGYELPSPPEKISVTGGGGRYHIEAEGVQVHAQYPERGENAIGRLAIYLSSIPFEGRVRDAISFIAEKIGMDALGIGLGCDIADKISGHFSFNLGVLDADEKHMTVRLNYRYPVTFSYDDCHPHIAEAFLSAGWENISSVHKPKLYVPEDDMLVRSLLKVYREHTGDISAPKSIGGGTYAKAIPNILAFGPIFPGDPVVEHMPDEYISIDRLVKNSQVIASAIVELANNR